MEPNDDDPTLETCMDDAEVQRLASLASPIDEVPLMCVMCCGVIGFTCSCATEVHR